MKITVAHSPDSDDAFMFYALANGKIDTDGLEIDQVLQDIETLNRARVRGRVRGHGGHRSTPTPISPIGMRCCPRRQHGRRLRPDGRRPAGRSDRRSAA